MSDNFAELRTAIDANQGPDTIKQLIEKLSPKQVYDFLLSKQNNTKTLEQLATSKPKEIAFILLAKAQKKYFQDNNEFNWFKIFDLLEDFLLSQKHKHKKITAKRLATKLHFLSRYKEEIDVFTLVNRPKFLAAALLLGARPKPNASLFEFVVNSNLKSKPKKDLIAWLLDNKFIEQKSIGVELFSEIIRKKILDIAKILLKHFPSMLEDVDDKGRNVLHFCVPNAHHVRLRMFRQCWEFAVSNTSDDQIYRILTTKSSDGVTLAISIVKEGIGHSSFVIPRQVMDALARLAREGKQNILEELYNGTRNFYRNYVLKSYLIQCGMTTDVPHFTFRKDVKDLSQVLWFVKQNTSNSKKKLMMNMNAKDNTRKMEIMTLPNELLSIIIMDLKPSDLMHFAMTCKHAMEIIVSKQNEVFWKEYYERNLKIGSENWQGQTYKAKFIQDTKGQCNWRKKKYTTIKLENRAPQLMDENWLVSRNGFGTLSYWNCHTQQEVVPELHLSYAKPLALLSTYSQGVLPPVIYTTYPFVDMPSLTIRDSNGVDHIPKTANEEITSTINFIKPIDHRILIDKEALLYNAEVDKFIPCKEANEYGFVTRFNGVSVNPFNRTFTKVSGVTGRLGVYNYEYELLTFLPYQRNYDYSILETVDEYTLFFQEFSNSGPNGYLDLRTGKILWEESHFLPMRHENQYHIAEYAVSPTRIVTRGDNTELLASFHLPSQKFEWIYQPDANFKQGFLAPIAVNKRYLATKYNHHTVLFDYCSDL